MAPDQRQEGQPAGSTTLPSGYSGGKPVSASPLEGRELSPESWNRT